MKKISESYRGFLDDNIEIGKQKFVFITLRLKILAHNNNKHMNTKKREINKNEEFI